MQKDHRFAMITCALFEDGRAPDFELLLDPTATSLPESANIDGLSFTALRPMREMEDGTIEHRVFMVQDSLPGSNRYGDMLRDNWNRGYRVSQHHP